MAYGLNFTKNATDPHSLFKMPGFNSEDSICLYDFYRNTLDTDFERCITKSDFTYYSENHLVKLRGNCTAKDKDTTEANYEHWGASPNQCMETCAEDQDCRAFHFMKNVTSEWYGGECAFWTESVDQYNCKDPDDKFTNYCEYHNYTYLNMTG